MIRAVSYANGKVHETSLEQLNVLRNSNWIDVKNPSLRELDELKKKFNVKLSDLNHCLDVNEVPRIRVHGNYALIILSTLCDEEGGKTCSSLGVILSRKFMITIHTSDVDAIEKLDVHEESTKELFKAGLDLLLYKLFSNVIKEFSNGVNKLGDEIDMVEEHVLRHYDETILYKISDLKNMVLYLRKALFGNRNMVTALMKERMIQNNTMFEDIIVEVHQLIDMIELHRERLTMILDMFLTSASNRVNDVMKSFTVIAAVLLVPMLITGLYGMNVVLPFQQHQYAFWIVIGIIIIAILLMLMSFKLKKWV